MSRLLATALLFGALALVLPVPPAQANGPIEIGRLDLPDLTSFALSEPFVYAVQGDEIVVLDVSDPAMPVEHWRFSDPDIRNIAALAIDGTHLYAMGDWWIQYNPPYPGEHRYSLGAFDVTNPAQLEPRHIRILNDHRKDSRITLTGGHVFTLGAHDSNPRHVRIHDGRIYKVWQYSTWGGLNVHEYPSDMPPLVSSSSPFNSPLLGGLEFRVTGEGLVLHGDHAFVNGEHSLMAINASNHTSMTFVGALPVEFEGIVGAGSSWLLGWTGDRLALIDVSNPSELVEVASLPYQGILDVAVAGDLAYVLLPGGLRVVDLGRHVIAVQVQGSGLVSPAGNQLLHENGDVTLSFTPAPGYELIEVLVDGESRGPVTSYGLEGVGENHEVRVVFKPTSEELARRTDRYPIGMRSLVLF